MNKQRIWTLLALAGVLTLALAACDADDLRNRDGDRPADRSGLVAGYDVNGDGRVDATDLDGEKRVEFTGFVDSVADGEWVVSDCRLFLADDTRIEYGVLDMGDEDGDRDGDLVATGDPVKVEAWLTRGDVLVAREIKVIERDEVDADLLPADADNDRDGENDMCLVVLNSGDGSDNGEDSNENDDGDEDRNDDNNPGKGNDKGKGDDKGKGND